MNTLLLLASLLLISPAQAAEARYIRTYPGQLAINNPDAAGDDRRKIADGCRAVYERAECCCYGLCCCCCGAAALAVAGLTLLISNPPPLPGNPAAMFDRTLPADHHLLRDFLQYQSSLWGAGCPLSPAYYALNAASRACPINLRDELSRHDSDFLLAYDSRYSRLPGLGEEMPEAYQTCPSACYQPSGTKNEDGKSAVRKRRSTKAKE